MTQIQTFQNSTYKIECVFVDDNPWFRGKDVATVLGYANTTKAIINNVDEDDKKKMEELGNPSEGLPDANARKTVYINESGLYSLILRSERPEAKHFNKWVCSEVLPSIRKRGSYTEPPPPPPPESPLYFRTLTTRPTAPSQCNRKTISTPKWLITSDASTLMPKCWLDLVSFKRPVLLELRVGRRVTKKAPLT